jgi:hypothetical protein
VVCARVAGTAVGVPVQRAPSRQIRGSWWQGGVMAGADRRRCTAGSAATSVSPCLTRSPSASAPGWATGYHAAAYAFSVPDSAPGDPSGHGRPRRSGALTLSPVEMRLGYFGPWSAVRPIPTRRR